MTYCIGIKTNEGLVFASDSRTNAGLDNVNIYSKMLTHDIGDRTIVIVTSGNLGTSQAVFKSIDVMDYIADTIEITSMWGNVLKPGETHQPHSHSNNFLSGVFYIDADNTSGITFQDPRPGANVILPRKKNDHIDNANLLNYKAKTNRIIIFPSWLVHWVPTNKSTKDRISISWNIQIKGQLGERHEYQSGQF